MTDERLALVAKAIDAHLDLDANASTGEWRYICDCGEVLLTGPNPDEAIALHEQHRAAAVLAALDGVTATP